jgi:hypothetical protein
MLLARIRACEVRKRHYDGLGCDCDRDDDSNSKGNVIGRDDSNSDGCSKVA